MPARVRMPRGWTYDGDNSWVRQFGPIKATTGRTWGPTPEPTAYYAFLSVGNTKFTVPVADLGVPWHDDNIDALAVQALERLIKQHIRGWLKPPRKVQRHEVV